MTKIRLSNGVQIKDPILTPVIDKCTQLILASINQQLLAKADENQYKYKAKKLKVGGVKKVSFNPSGSIILKQMKPETTKDFSKFAKKIARDTLFRPKLTSADSRFRPGYLDSSVVSVNDLKQKGLVLSNKNLIQKTFAGIAVDRLNESYVKQFLEKHQSIEEDGDRAANTNKHIKFRVHEVKCIDETGSTSWGSDEIAMGGVFLDPKGNTFTKNEFRVKNDFDNNEIKRYSPPKVLHSFKISNSVDIQTYSAFISLAEKDSGGFSNFLSDLYDSIRSEVQVILKGLGVAAGAWIGSQIGGAVGTAVGGPIGSIIGIAAGSILGAVIGAFINAFRDDIFNPQMATVALPFSNATFSSCSHSSAIDFLNFIGHNGHYTVKYDWLITPTNRVAVTTQSIIKASEKADKERL